MNPLILPAMDYNRTTTVLLEGWISYWITQEGWYAIKDNNFTKAEMNKEWNLK